MSALNGARTLIAFTAMLLVLQQGAFGPFLSDFAKLVSRSTNESVSTLTTQMHQTNGDPKTIVDALSVPILSVVNTISKIMVASVPAIFANQPITLPTIDVPPANNTQTSPLPGAATPEAVQQLLADLNGYVIPGN